MKNIFKKNKKIKMFDLILKYPDVSGHYH